MDIISKDLRKDFLSKIKDYYIKKDTKKFLDCIGSFSEHKKEEIRVFFASNHDAVSISLEMFIDSVYKDDIRRDVMSWIFGSEFGFSEKEMLEMLKLAFVYKIYVLDLVLRGEDNINHVLKEYDELKEENNFEFYRGQANIDWNMSPSVLRDLNKDIVLDDNGYYHLIKTNGLMDKYKNIFGNRGAYYRYAFLQHACSYSPLIDLTHQQLIAASFALANPNSFNTFNNKDAVIYQISYRNSYLDKEDVYFSPDQARDFLKTKFNIKVINSNRICFGRTYRLKKYDRNGKETHEFVSFTTIDELIRALTPKYAFIDCPTNDRMVYQKGLFLVLYDCVALKSNILYDLNPKFTFTKTIIRCADKKDLIKQIRDSNEGFTYEHLMNPYLFFNK